MYMGLFFEIIDPPFYGAALMRCLRRMSGVRHSYLLWEPGWARLSLLKMPWFANCNSYCPTSSFFLLPNFFFFRELCVHAVHPSFGFLVVFRLRPILFSGAHVVPESLSMTALSSVLTVMRQHRPWSSILCAWRLCRQCMRQTANSNTAQASLSRVSDRRCHSCGLCMLLDWYHINYSECSLRQRLECCERAMFQAPIRTSCGVADISPSQPFAAIGYGTNPDTGLSSSIHPDGKTVSHYYDNRRRSSHHRRPWRADDLSTRSSGRFMTSNILYSCY